MKRNDENNYTLKEAFASSPDLPESLSKERMAEMLKNKKITLTFCEYEHKKIFGNEFELNKNDIYYENAGGFEMENNCINLDVINDLTLLRNIYLHLKYENKAYLYVGNILIALKHSHKINIANINISML